MNFKFCFEWFKKALFALAIAVTLCGMAGNGVSAAPSGETSAAMVKRKILVLYDGAKETGASTTQVHKLAEMPLNYLGYDLRYVDISKSLPALDEISSYRAVLTWFSGALAKDADYLRWADRAAARGVKFVVLGDIGARVDETRLPLINKFLAHLGLALGNDFITETTGTRIKVLDKTIVGYERPFFTVIPPYSVFQSTSDAPQLHLVLQAPERNRNVETILAAHNEHGGFIHSGFISMYDPERNWDKWLINPFEFFRLALGDETFPIPDVTTLSGRRMYFSHVDGDGWLNVTQIEGYRDKGLLASEVMLCDLIAPFPDLPVTVGLLTGDLDASLGGNPQGEEAARKIYALPQVEVASHTHTHPFHWQFFEHYSRERELALLKRGRPKTEGVFGRLVDIVAGEPAEVYVSGSADTPRAYMRRPFDLNEEIGGSLKIAESYAPPGKKAALIQWSGDTMPFAAAIRASRKAGVRNINGGDPRYDIEWPSISYLSPISRMVGGERQIYAAASNENTFTNDWTGPFYGFQSLAETLKNTDLPRRLAPFNLYYHTYSAEREASRDAVLGHLKKARNGSYTPVRTSHYAAIADSFFEAEILKAGDDCWRVKKRGDLQTLRFDNADGLAIDFSRSRGVIGESRHGGSLYAALDAAVFEPLIAVRKGTAAYSPPHPILHDSRWLIDHVAVGDCSLAFSAHGFGHGEMDWKGFKPGAYSLQAKKGDQTLWRTQIEVAHDGELKTDIPVDAIDGVVVSFVCQPSGREVVR